MLDWAWVSLGDFLYFILEKISFFHLGEIKGCHTECYQHNLQLTASHWYTYINTCWIMHPSCWYLELTVHCIIHYTVGPSDSVWTLIFAVINLTEILPIQEVFSTEFHNTSIVLTLSVTFREGRTQCLMWFVSIIISSIDRLNTIMP